MAHYDLELKNNIPPVLFIPADSTKSTELSIKPTIELGQFEFDTLKFPSNIYICGKRNSGKSVLLKHILANCPFIKTNSNYKIFYITSAPFDSICKELDKIPNITNKLVVSKSHEFNFNQLTQNQDIHNILIIEDDICRKVYNSYLLNLVDTQNNNLTNILISKYPFISSTAAKKFQYRFCFYDIMQNNRKRLYELFAGYFDTFPSFDSTFTFYTKTPFSFMVYNCYTNLPYFCKIQLMDQNSFIDKKNIKDDDYYLNMEDEILLLEHKIVI